MLRRRTSSISTVVDLWWFPINFGNNERRWFLFDFDHSCSRRDRRWLVYLVVGRNAWLILGCVGRTTSRQRHSSIAQICRNTLGQICGGFSRVALRPTIDSTGSTTSQWLFDSTLHRRFIGGDCCFRSAWLRRPGTNCNGCILSRTTTASDWTVLGDVRVPQCLLGVEANPGIDHQKFRNEVLG